MAMFYPPTTAELEAESEAARFITVNLPEGEKLTHETLNWIRRDIHDLALPKEVMVTLSMPFGEAPNIEHSVAHLHQNIMPDAAFRELNGKHRTMILMTMGVNRSITEVIAAIVQKPQHVEIAPALREAA
jgi:hypothetical protein